jgi:hypothetical protein
MSKLYLLLLLLTVMWVSVGCKTHSGSRDYHPGKGWSPND